jgi:hypothetical protein
MSALPDLAKACRPTVSIEAFENGSIDPADFDHEAHVHIGWAYLGECELRDAVARFSAALRRLTIKLGIESKYHETITWFFMILIAERLGREAGERRGTQSLRITRPVAGLAQNNPSIRP